MTPDPLQERVARVVREADRSLHGEGTDYYIATVTAAVLADLRETGELRTYEQVGSRWHDGKMVATYIVREDNTPKVCDVCGGTGFAPPPPYMLGQGGNTNAVVPCPRGCKPEGEKK